MLLLRRLLRPAVALVATTVVLSGCLRTEFGFDISDEGTVDVSVLIAFDTEQITEFAEMMGFPTDDLDELTGPELLQELGDGTNPCSDLEGSLSEFDVDASEFEDGSFVGVSCTVRGVPVDGLNDLGDDSSLTITQADGTTTFDLTLGGIDELTGGGEEIPLPGLDFEDLFDVKVLATAPGSLSEHNASSTSGSTATWTITPEATFIEGNAAVMSAVWTPGGSSDTDWLLPLIIALAVIVALAAGAVFLARRSGDRSTSESGSEPDPDTGAGSAPDAEATTLPPPESPAADPPPAPPSSPPTAPPAEESGGSPPPPPPPPPPS